MWRSVRYSRRPGCKYPHSVSAELWGAGMSKPETMYIYADRMGVLCYTIDQLIQEREESVWLGPYRLIEGRGKGMLEGEGLYIIIQKPYIFFSSFTLRKWYLSLICRKLHSFTVFAFIFFCLLLLYLHSICLFPLIFTLSSFFFHIFSSLFPR